jgi:hypothetical protein
MTGRLGMDVTTDDMDNWPVFTMAVALILECETSLIGYRMDN